MKATNLHGYQEQIRQLQNELAVSYLPAVKAMAYRLKERLPPSVDAADLISIGAEELVKLSKRYDTSLNDSFWGYAKKRVYGAMLDYLRSLDIVSRGDRKLIKDVESAILRHMADHEEEPSDEELATLLNEEVEKVREARNAASIYSLMPLDEQMQIFDDHSIIDKIERDELIDIIKSILASLPKKEQLVIQLYYFEELNFKEISSIMGITESRISQIHKLVITKIRERLGGSHG
ncbi:MAG: RNA polymerase sigma factor FliA [Campylobacterales bacterium]